MGYRQVRKKYEHSGSWLWQWCTSYPIGNYFTFYPRKKKPLKETSLKIKLELY
jgi:hypothetical protein